jgi:hypothetical protein
VPGREVVAARGDRRAEQHEVGAPDLLDEPGPQGEVQAPLELLLPLPPELAGADRGERVDDDLGGVQALRELEGAAGPAHRLPAPAGGGVGRRQVGVGHRQLPSRRERLQERDRLAGRPLGLHGAAGAPEDLRQPAERVPLLLQPLAELAAVRQRVLDRLHRGVVLVGQVAGVGASLEQLRALGHGQPVAEAEGARALRGRLAVGAEPGRAGGGRRRVAQDRAGAAGGLGMVGEPRQVERAAGWVGERRHRPAVQAGLAVRWHRLLHGEPGQLVPERHARRLGDEHAGRQALVQLAGRVAGDRLQQPGLGVRRHDRDRFQERRSRRAEPRGTGEDRVPDHVRDPVHAGAERLDHEERVAGGLAVELAGVDAVRLGEPRHHLGREPGEPHPPDRPAPRQVAEHDPQRMRPVELVVAVAGDHQRRHRLDPAGEQPQDVEGRSRRRRVLVHRSSPTSRAWRARSPPSIEPATCLLEPAGVRRAGTMR